MKRCNKCKEDKELDQFSKNKNNTDGHHNQCKSCRKEYNLKNTDKTKVYDQKYKGLNKDRHKDYDKQYYLSNKPEILEYQKLYKINHKEEIDQYNIETREKHIEYIRNWRLLNPKYHQKYKSKRKQHDPVFRLYDNIGCSIRNSFKNCINGKFSKSKRTQDILGCSLYEFYQFIESKQEEWMNSDNYGLYNGEFNYGWDLDHIIPLSSAKTEEDIYKLNHYTNFQPLCSKINRDIKWKY